MVAFWAFRLTEREVFCLVGKKYGMQGMLGSSEILVYYLGC